MVDYILIGMFKYEKRSDNRLYGVWSFCDFA